MVGQRPDIANRNDIVARQEGEQRDMNLDEIIPDPEVVMALEPEELGLRLLPMLANWASHESRDVGSLSARVCGDPRIQMDHPAGRGSTLRSTAKASGSPCGRRGRGLKVPHC